MSVMLLSLLSTYGLKSGSQLTISRRAAAVSLISWPTLLVQPHAASAGIFGDDGPQGEFRALKISRTQLDELASKLDKGDVQGNSEEGAIVVLQTLSIQFSGTSKLLQKASAEMPLLASAEASKAIEKAAAFQTSLEEIKQGCRDREAKAQLAGIVAASGVLDDFFAIAVSKYKVPAAAASLAYSSDPKEFTAQYFGIFSCEGQGLERIPGSNSCKDPPNKASNKNPFPTRNVGDFDLLTGKPK